MESFNSEWIVDPSSGYSIEPIHTPDASPIANSASNINFNYKCAGAESDNPQLSGDSQEYLSEQTLKPKKSEQNVAKFNLTNTTSLAKKRLQAYSQQIHKIQIEEKSECKERQDVSFKKKKDRTDKAKSVIEEIEEEKRKEIRKEIEDNNIRQLMATTAKFIHHQSRDFTEQFRRREIKQRNYRRTDSSSRKSVSPEVHHRSKTRSSPVHKYPKDWSEYNSYKYNDKPSSKNHSKNRSVKDVIDNLYNFHHPPPYIEQFKYGTENGTKEISPFFLKQTKSKPSIVYSVNVEHFKESFLTKDQLYQLVSEERRQTIKNVISSHSKLQPFNKTVESKPWYNKVWRKHRDAECKVLENSVGLSFLQTYSDEEEENETEEILVCSSINNANNSKIDKVPNDSFRLTKQIDKSCEEIIVTTESQEEELQSTNRTFEESDASLTLKVTKIPEDDASLTLKLTKIPEDDASLTLNVTKISEDETGILTPEIPLQLQKSFKRTDSTKVELDNQKDIEENIDESKPKHKHKIRKKKTAKKKTETTPKKKKKKRKRKRQTSDEKSDSSEEEQKKVKRKKSKDKIGKTSKNKKDTKKTSSSKDLKSKKKAKLSEQLDLKEKFEKKKKSETENIEKKSPMLDDLRKKLKEKHKKRKDSKSRSLDTEELRKENKKDSGKHDEPKTIDLIAINKSYRRNLELDGQEKQDSSNSEMKRSHSKTPKKSKKRDFEDEFTQKDTQVDTFVAKTPDTDEYKGNWEKDSFGSLEENLLLQTKLNSSWESDDEIYERQERPNENVRNYTEDSSFEIPLNIKPFKKRDMDALKIKIIGTKLDDEEIIPIYLPVKETSRRLEKLKIEAAEIKKPSRKLKNFKIDVDEIKRPSRRTDELKINTEVDKKTSKRVDEFKINIDEINKPSRRTDESKIDVDEIKKPSRRTDEFKINTEEKKKKTPKRVDEYKIDTGETKRTSMFDEFNLNSEDIKEVSRIDESKINTEVNKKISKRVDEFKLDTEENKRAFKIIDEFKIDTAETKRPSKGINNEFKSDTEDIKEASIKVDDFKIDSEQVISMNVSLQDINKNIKNVEQKHESIIPVIPKKKRRWDKTERESTPNSSLKTSNLSVASLNSSSLEHEYVEFMKAVTSNTDSLSSSKIDDSVISVSSNESVEILGSLQLDMVQEGQRKPECVISPKDIPFIPMPDEIKPVPVPCPVVENIPKPLLNFDLSTRIVKGLDSPIKSHLMKSFGTPVFAENDDSYADSSTQARIDDVSSSSNIILEPVSKEIETSSSPIKPFTFTPMVLVNKKILLENSKLEAASKEIESSSSPKKLFSFTPMVLPTKKTLFDHSNLEEASKEIDTSSSPKIPFTFTPMVLPTRKTLLDNSNLEAASKEIETGSSPKKPFTFTPMILPNKKTLLDNSNLEAASNEIETGDSPKKPFTFTTLILPSKKTLLDNSNLKLCDSDDETDNTMKPIDEIRREHLTESDVEGSIQTKRMSNEETAIKTPKPEEPVVKQERLQQTSLSPPPKTVQSGSVKSEKRDSSPKRNRKRESSPKRKTHSPKRESSPKRRRRSPERHRDRERDRRRKVSGVGGGGGRRYSSRRTRSPSYSPRRRSPRRSLSPRSRSSTKSTSKNADRYISNSKKPKVETPTAETPNQKSPTIASPLEGLKRSVADSTISDDSLLPQPNLEEYTQSPLPQFFNMNKSEEKRLSLDERINMELGWHKEELQPISTTYESYHYNQDQFLQAPQVFSPNPDRNRNNYSNANFVQIGNMVQIVPKDLAEMDNQSDFDKYEKKSQILQVGNMIQIVPNEMPEIPLPPLPSSLPKEDPPIAESTLIDIVSPEDLNLTDNVCERRAERDKRKQDREARRKEKENRRREKEKQRNVKMKEKTENMIMRALQLEVESTEEVEGEFNESLTHWPPSLNASGSKDVLNKSILVQGRRRSRKSKSVQFADGIRPGDGTSPSAGEDLCSPPPSKVLPKEKRYTRTKLRVRNMKKKVKVKIIKHNQDQSLDEDGDENGDDDDDLPPPSPPPGSPPPHIFPPRIKTIINNMQAYVPNVLGNQNQPVYASTVNPLMATQTLSRLQQFNMASGQPNPPPLPESHIPVHHLAHYPLASVVAPPPPPVVNSDSSFGTPQRNPHLYKYTTH